MGARRDLPAAVVAVVALLAMASCSEGGADPTAERPGQPAVTDAGGGGEPVPGGVLRLGIERPATFDPAAASPASQSELLTADLLFDGLTAVGRDGEVVAAVAEDWDESADLRTWRFTIADDARFSDGQPVTAADVVFSLERVASLGGASLAGVRLEVVAGYEAFVEGGAPGLAGLVAVDERTVEVVLASPLAVLPELLANPAFGIVSAEQVEVSPFFDAPVGSGPFALSATDDGVVRLVRAGEGSALLDGVELHVYDDLASAYDDFVAGRLDWTLVPPERVDDAAERFGTGGFAPFHAELFYGFNLANPKFADVRFRQAILKAVDREAVVNAVYFGIADPLHGAVPAGVPGHQPDPCGEPCAFDPDAARALVAAAFPAGNVPEVRIDYYEGASEDAVAGILENSLEAVGIPATRRPLSFEAYQQFAVSGQQELFRLGWIGAYRSPHAYLGPLFSAGGLDNATGFNDPAVQALLAEAAAEPGEAARLGTYRMAEEAVMELAPILPIAQFRTAAVAGERVRDLELSVDGTFAGDRVWLAGE